MNTSTIMTTQAAMPQVNSLNSIVDELIISTPITWFGYARFSRDREFLVSSTNESYDQFYIDHECYLRELSRKHFDDIASGSFFCEGLVEDATEADLQVEVMHLFGLTNFLVIIEKNDQYCHIYSFASSRTQRNMSNFYLNNIHFLEKFISTNRSKIQGVIGDLSPPVFQIPFDGAIADSKEHEEQSVYADPKVSADLLNVDAAPGGPSNGRVGDFSKLTKREVDCLKYILRGLTSKEIAKELSLSFRTIENYCERIKSKLGCRRKQDILLRYADIF